MKKQVIHTEGAPKALGPYSQGVKAGPWVFVSGQLGIDLATGNLTEGGAAAQAERAFLSVAAILETAGVKMHQVVRVTLYLADMGDFAAVNEVMGRFFPAEPPARVTIQASRLPRDAKVEVEAQAFAG